MYQTIEEFLDTLKDELTEDDPALVQGALTDTRVLLSNALEAARRETPDISASDAM